MNNIYYCTCNTYSFLQFPLNLGIWFWSNYRTDGLVQFFRSFLKRTLALSVMQLFKSLLIYIFWHFDKTILRGFPSRHYILFWIFWYEYHKFFFIIIHTFFFIWNITGISFSIALNRNSNYHPLTHIHVHTFGYAISKLKQCADCSNDCYCNGNDPCYL